MKKRYDNIEQVFEDAEKNKQEAEYKRAEQKDSPEKLADYTVKAAEEEKFEASVNGNKVEADKKDRKKDDVDKEAEEQSKKKHLGIGVGAATLDGVTAFGTSAAFSLVNNEALSRTQIPQALEQATNAALRRLRNNVGKEL